MAKWIIGIIIAALVIGGLWYSGFLSTMLTPPSATTSPTSSTQSTTTQQAAAQPQPENGMSANNDASDAALSQDTAAIDAQMQGLTTDTAQVNASATDQPVQQSY
jgi:hypothetical protein